LERNKLSIKDTRLQEISDNFKKIGIQPSQYPAYTDPNIFVQQFKNVQSWKMYHYMLLILVCQFVFEAYQGFII